MVPAILFWIVARLGHGEFRARSAGGAEDPDRWVALHAHVAGQDGVTRPLGATVRTGDGFVFEYTTSRPDHRYLMVLAVAADGDVRWFYPEHADPAADPVSIAITAAAGAELPDRIEHELPVGPLAIYAVFTAEPLSVSRVERLIARAHVDPAAPARLAVPGSAQAVVHSEVVP